MSEKKKRGYYIMPESSVSRLARAVDGMQVAGFEHTPTAPLDAENMESRHTSVMGLIDQSMEMFANNLHSGNVEIKTVQDFKALIESMQKIQGLKQLEQEHAEALDESTRNAPVIDADDPKVIELYEQMFMRLNERNDE